MTAKDCLAIFLLIVSTAAGGLVGLNVGVRLLAAIGLVPWV